MTERFTDSRWVRAASVVLGISAAVVPVACAPQAQVSEIETPGARATAEAKGGAAMARSETRIARLDPTFAEPTATPTPDARATAVAKGDAAINRSERITNKDLYIQGLNPDRYGITIKGERYIVVPIETQTPIGAEKAEKRAAAAMERSRLKDEANLRAIGLIEPLN